MAYTRTQYEIDLAARMAELNELYPHDDEIGAMWHGFAAAFDAAFFIQQNRVLARIGAPGWMMYGGRT